MMDWLEKKIVELIHKHFGQKLDIQDQKILEIKNRVFDKGEDLRRDFNNFIVEATEAYLPKDALKEMQNRFDERLHPILQLLKDSDHRIGELEVDHLDHNQKLGEQFLEAVKYLNERIDQENFNRKSEFESLLTRVKDFEEIKFRMDDGIVLMTRNKLLSLIEQKIEVFEGNINNKMSGLMTYVNDKTTHVTNGKTPDVELLKKLARLEGLKDAIEHRRSADVLLKKKHDLINEMVVLEKTDVTAQLLQSQINILNWALGGSI